MHRSLAIALLALTPLAPSAHAQCDDWRAGPAQNNQALNGSDGVVYSLLSWDPTGSGLQQPMLVAGGSFNRMQDATVHNLAILDPATGQWGPLGDLATFTSQVNAFTVFNGSLLAASDRALRWDGAAWQATDHDHCMSAFTNMNSQNVKALCVFQNTLVGGGSWTGWFSNTTPCDGQFGWGLSQWDGTAHWYRPSFDFWAMDSVNALTQFGPRLIVGGTFYFGECSCNPGEYIATWDGAAWDIMGGGLNGPVNAVAVFQNQLYVGGEFTLTGVGGLTLNHIARWDGAAWHALGSGLNGPVTSLTVHQNNLVVGGTFFASGALALNDIASWDGSAWHALGSGMDTTVECVTSWNGQLVAGGLFSTAGGQPANHIARWDGAQWSPFGGGTVNSLYALTQYGFANSRLVAAGDFQQSTPIDQPAHNIVSWNGLYLSPLGSGMNAPVHALKSFSTSFAGQTTFHLVAGGEFTTAGGVAASRVAEWNENATTVLNPPAWVALGNGFNGTVFAVERFNNVIYAAGAFTASGATSLAHIAQWNGSAWVAVGTGLNGTCNALKVYNGQLYAGGSFTTAGGLSSGGLARWNGTSWSIVGGNFAGTVYALETWYFYLAIGGSYPGLSGNPNIALYNSSTGAYSVLDTSGGANGAVRSLLSENGFLYAGGDFTHIGGVAAAHFARIDGLSFAWAAVHGGADNTVSALAAFNNEVHAGGDFLNVRSGAIPSPGWARYLETGVPWFPVNPQSTSGQCGHEVSFSAHGALGYSGNGTWRHNGVLLSDGPTGTGSIIAGCHNPVLDVANIGPADAGAYDLLVTNACGSAASSAASLDVTGCCGSADFNCDGDTGTDADIESFFACIAGTCPPPPCPSTADFNGDGDVGTDADIEAFFRVLAGGAC
jgi:hypothetical protein